MQKLFWIVSKNMLSGGLLFDGLNGMEILFEKKRILFLVRILQIKKFKRCWTKRNEKNTGHEVQCSLAGELALFGISF